MPIQGMPPINQQSHYDKKGKRGKVSKLDNIKHGDPVLAGAISEYG